MAPRLKLFMPLVLFAVLALFLLRGLELDPKEMPSALIDQPLPQFSCPAWARKAWLVAIEVIGEVALFNVWATWCVSCRVEHPYLQQLAERGVPIYGVNYKDDDAMRCAGWRNWVIPTGSILSMPKASWAWTWVFTVRRRPIWWMPAG